MPLYFFDLYEDEKLSEDVFGLDLADLYEARDQAIALLPDLARERSPDGEDHDYRAVVRSSDGRVRYEATLSLRGAWVEPPSSLPVTRPREN